MSIKYMDMVNVPLYEAGRIDAHAFEYSETLITTKDGDTVIIPTNIQGLSVTLEITAGSGKMQVTTNKLADVISDTSVAWVDWDSGVVATTTQDFMLPATALRMVNVTGTTRILIRAQ